MSQTDNVHILQNLHFLDEIILLKNHVFYSHEKRRLCGILSGDISLVWGANPRDPTMWIW
jgi:hypothetical protein